MSVSGEWHILQVKAVYDWSPIVNKVVVHCYARAAYETHCSTFRSWLMIVVMLPRVLSSGVL